MRGLRKKLASLASFLLELVVYAAFVLAYFFLVLHFLGDWIKQVFESDKTYYALVAVGLISAQGIVLERLTTALLWVIRCLQAITPVLHRLLRPYESTARLTDVMGLLVYRFAGPLYYFNAPYFARRVKELIDTADPPVTVFLINAEAITDMDMNALEALEEIYHTLRRKKIVLGLCEVKGNFREVLMTTHLPGRVGFVIYPSVEVAVRELTRARAKKDRKSVADDDQVPLS